MEQIPFPWTWAGLRTWPRVLALGLQYVRFQEMEWREFLQRAFPIFQRVYRWLSRWLVLQQALLEQVRLQQAAARRKVAASKVVSVMAKVLAAFAKKA